MHLNSPAIFFYYELRFFFSHLPPLSLADPGCMPVLLTSEWNMNHSS